MTRRWRRVLGALGGAATLVAWSVPARAHELELSFGEYRASPEGLEVSVSLAAPELMRLVPELDHDRSGVVDAAELARGRSRLEVAVLGRIDVSPASGSCRSRLGHVAGVGRGGLRLIATYRCDVRGVDLRIDLRLLDELDPSHRHAATVRSGDFEAEVLCARGRSALRVPAYAAGGAGSPRSDAGSFVLALVLLAVSGLGVFWCCERAARRSSADQAR